MKELAVALAPTIAAQIGEGLREWLGRRAAERERSRERRERLIAEAKAERKETT